MHYYKFNIADYRKDTGHLTTIEHGIYRQLIDWQYLDEQPIPLETQVVMRRLRLGSEHETSLLNVLSDFFAKGNEGYSQTRIRLEINEYHGQADKNRTNGKLGGRPKKTQSVIDGNPDESQNNPNHKPLTTNHKPLTKDKTATSVAPPDGVSQSVWDEFVAHRKRKKETVSKLVVAGIQKEADKAGWTLEDALSETVIRGWKSFKAIWVAKKSSSQAQTLSFAERDQLAKQKRWEEMTGRQWPTESQSFIDVDTSVLELK
jgi:uncharacterized protein YdaU (DUF1376 family)